MKKSSFVALTLGTVSTVLFALGMCMVLLEEWNAFISGIVMGCVGILLGLITVIIWRKMENKNPIKFSRKVVSTIIVGSLGALALSVGMCFCMVWKQMVIGILIGLVGIIVLLCLIPLTKGLK